ncbi:MAG TPA: hypothetical protein DDZ56_12990 [Cytophagales bacterium]|nr:hypothetical protein [Cytophagales bacterium]
MDEKPELIVVSENKLGGVQSYFNNLLQGDRLDSFHKQWILIDHTSSRDAKPTVPYTTADARIFSPVGDSLLSTCASLANMISDVPGVVLVNYELELIALHRYRRNNKTVFFFCHDEMYVANALRFEFLIDVFVTHNTHFYKELRERLPFSRRNDVYYLPYGIRRSPIRRSEGDSREIRLFFLARLTAKKGIFDLSKIDDILQSKGVPVRWVIVGDGPDKEALIESLKDRPYFSFHSPAETSEIFTLAAQCDIFVLPSYLDGTPVALLEAMSVGLVPIVSRFNSGISDIVKTDIGFVVGVADVNAFAERICWLHHNRVSLESMSLAAHALMKENYDLEVCCDKYYDLFRQFRLLKKPVRKRLFIYEGRLDLPVVPAFVRNGIRSLRKRLLKYQP